MSERVHDLSDSAMIAAIEANLFAFFSLLGSWPQIEIHDDPAMLWSLSDVPFPLFNSVLRANLSPEAADATIDMVIERGRDRDVPLLWWLGPSTLPADLGSTLEAHGFAHVDDLPGMAVDLHVVNESVPIPPRLTVELVDDVEMLAMWCQAASLGFGMPEFISSAFFDGMASIGFGPQASLRNYVARLDSQPVATASLCLGAGVAGIYNIATIPSARRQGIGAAVTLAVLQEARALGYRVGILHASQMGAGVYRKLGFRELCTISQYVWEGQQTAWDDDE